MSEQLNQLNVGGMNTNPSKSFFPPRFTNNYEARDVDIASMGSQVMSMASYNTSNLPAIDVLKLNKNNKQFDRLKTKLLKKKRMFELMAWAKEDYGIDMKPKKGEPKLPEKASQIENEVDFIFKVKQKYITKRNNEVACKL